MNRRRQKSGMKIWNQVGAHVLSGLPLVVRPAKSAMDRLGHGLSKRLLPLVPTATALLVANVANASGGGDDAAHHEPHVQNWVSLSPADNAEAPAIVWMAVTFAAFLAIIYMTAGRPFKNFLEMRHLEVKTAIEEAKKAKSDAERTKAEYEEKLARLDDDVAKLRSEFESRGKAEAERLEAAGRQTAQRLIKDAETTIQAELKQAEAALKVEAARIAVELAEEKIRTALTASDESRLRKDFLDGLAN